IQENVILAPYTTMKIGGRARFFVEAHNENDVVDALRFAYEKGLDVFVLGGGSNVLISDKGFDGMVMHIATQGVEFSKADESVTATVQAGEDWDDFVANCVERNLAGIECLSGIPGQVGGTPVQNVGAYGQEVSETIVSVRCLDRNSLAIRELCNEDCCFSYRRSIFNSTDLGYYIVLSVKFSLKQNGEPKIAYKDVRDYFVDRTPTLTEVRDAVMAIRRSKSMVLDADDPNSRSAGSFFKNPIVGIEILAAIRKSFPGVPSFTVDADNAKIPAAWLIENAGFQKGFVLGSAAISSKHTLALINRGNATSGQIVNLKEKIQTEVESRFGILLEPEPIFVGF
ncbi:MAG: UDP-N-acetylmuramate dehydrogenase, partial [Pyrinomonadaceae bacterium]